MTAPTKKTTPLRLGNGKVRVTELHTSKRGKVYKRRHIEAATSNGAPGWFRRAMMRTRWFR